MSKRYLDKFFFGGVPYLTNDQLEEARALVKLGMQNKDIAEELGVPTSSVWKTLGEKGYRSEVRAN